MHPIFQRLIEANAEVERAKDALKTAEDHRRQCAVDLAQIENEEERWQAGVLAYLQFGKGIATAIAQGVTGLPGQKGVPKLIDRVGRRIVRSRSTERVDFALEPMTEWPGPDELERDLIQSHIDHSKPYYVSVGLGWRSVAMTLEPNEAAEYLKDATAFIAKMSGLSREDLVTYLSTEGSVYCEAITLKGTRCKSLVHNCARLSVGEWKAAMARGGYCGVHGG